MLISLLIFLLISNAVTLRRDKSILFSRITIKALFFSSFIALNNLYIKPLEKGIGIYGGLFHVNTFTQSFNIFVFVISATILILTAFYPRKVYIKSFSYFYKILSSNFLYNKNSISNKTGEQFRIIEYALIIIFIICGGVFLMNTADLISVFLSIELQSYGLYILSTIYRDSESATASGLTYFLLGGLSSCFILLGSGLIYANSGTTNLDNIYILYSIGEFRDLFQPFYIDLGLTIMLVGFLFKISAAPFHFWSPDVYDGIPTVVTTYVALIAKLSIFALFFDLFVNTNWRYEDAFKLIFFLSSFLSLIIGSVLGLTQSRIKRLFAYSTISHIGFILLALYVDSKESMQSFIFYILQYTISNLNAFMILLCIGFSLYLYVYEENEQGKDKKPFIDRNNSPIQLISQIKGYFYLNSFIAISFAVTLFSFIGIPPIAGFFAKQMILSAALDAGYSFLALVAILTSVIGAAYYLNLIKELFFYRNNYRNNPSIDKKYKTAMYCTGYIIPNSLHGMISNTLRFVNGSKQKENKQLSFPPEDDNLLPKNCMSVVIKPENITLNSGLSSTISVITLLLVLFIFIPGEWFNIVSILAALGSWKF